MQEYNIIIDIDENGNIKAETKGMKGDICINELDDILKDIQGKQSCKNKPEFYDKGVKRKTINKISLK